jgi:hypothetical protein
MSRATYVAEYRLRKVSGNFQDKRYKPKVEDFCLNCSSSLGFRTETGKQKKVCNNNKCQHDYARKQAIQLGIAGNGSVKRHLIETHGYQCSECGISEWNKKHIVLDLEHINGNSNDNTLENVCLLCPNCHSQTETYKSKNIGKGRGKIGYEPKPFYPKFLDQSDHL